VSVDAYPLTWPVTQPRTPKSARERARFGAVTKVQSANDPKISWDRRRAISTYDAITRLRNELASMRATGVVVSSNVPTRRDGDPYSNAREPDDSGVAVYFRRGDQSYCFACDHWDRVADNIAAVAANIKAIRGIERWKVGNLPGQAWRGFLALPAAQAHTPWWIILGFGNPPKDLESVRTSWRKMIAKYHSDLTGDHNRAAEINAAFQEAEKYYQERKTT
jgi:hypothetical protein